MIYTYFFFPDVTRQVTKEQAIDFFADWLKTVRFTPEMFRKETGDILIRRPDFYRFVYDPSIDKCIMEFGIGEEMIRGTRRHFFYGVTDDDTELFRIGIDNGQVELTDRQIESISNSVREKVFGFDSGDELYPLNNPAYFCIFEEFISNSVYTIWDNGVAVGTCDAEKLDKYAKNKADQNYKKAAAEGF